MSARGGVRQEVRGNRNVQIAHIENSSITVSIDSGPRRLVPLEPAWLELPAEVRSPARLLRARYAVVPFQAQGDLYQRLLEWSHWPDAFALRVVAGTAGAGKTRIGIELCRELARLDWLTGLLKLKVDLEALEVLVRTPTARLVVIDYAETRREQLDQVLPMLKQEARAEQPVRVLLTTRGRTASAEEVRRTLYEYSDQLDVLVDRAAIDLLSERPFGEVERAALFQAAVEAISHRLGGEAAEGRRLSPDLAGPLLTTPLMVLIAAYLGVAEGGIPTTRGELMEGILGHEDRYWELAAEAGKLSVDKALRRRAVALSTLVGVDPGQPEAGAEKEAAELLRLVPDLGRANEERRRVLARWVHELYPGSVWWNPVEPDLVGEHLVATTYGDQVEVLAGALTDRRPEALVQPLRLLARAAHDHSDLAQSLREVVTERMADLCRTAIEQAEGVDAPGLLQAGTTVAGALEPLVALAPPDPDRLPDVLEGFPQANTVLADLALTLSAQVADHYRDLAAEDPNAFELDLAMALNNLGFRLLELGRREPALKAGEEAVEIYRRLAAANPAAFEPDLAVALNNLGISLSELGRLEPALEASEEAIEIYRRLAPANPGAFEPDLAMALGNLGGDLSELGRREPALKASEEAVEVYRRLASADPAAFEPGLGRALHNLSLRLSELGQQEPAVKASEEAVAIDRRLAAANPAAFEPDLARALSNLGNRLSELGQREPALKASEQAVAIRRRLAAANPAAFEPDLARGLRGYAQVRAVGRRQLAEAVTAAQESIEIYGRLVRQLPDAFNDDLLEAQRTLIDLLEAQGRQAEADELRRRVGDRGDSSG